VDRRHPWTNESIIHGAIGSLEIRKFRFDFPRQAAFVKFIGTHAAYNDIDVLRRRLRRY